MPIIQRFHCRPKDSLPLLPSHSPPESYLQDLLNASGHIIVFLPHDVGVHDTRGRVQRIHRRVDPQLCRRRERERDYCLLCNYRDIITVRNDVEKEITSKLRNVKLICHTTCTTCADALHVYCCTTCADALHVLEGRKYCTQRTFTGHTCDHLHHIIPMTSLPRPLTGDGSGEDSGGVQVSECGGRCRVSKVIGRNKHRLHGGDGAFLCGGDPLLHGTHVGCQGRLVSHGRRNTTQQSRYLR